MKRMVKFLVIVLVLTSCAKEIEFNSPSFQGNREYGLWKAEFMSADIDDNGVLMIRASRNTETVILIIPSSANGIYPFGENNSMEAQYIDDNGVVYSTNNRPDPSVSIYPEIGYLNLNGMDNTNFTGTFEFLAFDETGLNAIGFNVGEFYRVPLVTETTL